MPHFEAPALSGPKCALRNTLCPYGFKVWHPAVDAAARGCHGHACVAMFRSNRPPAPDLRPITKLVSTPEERGCHGLAAGQAMMALGKQPLPFRRWCAGATAWFEGQAVRCSRSPFRTVQRSNRPRCPSSFSLAVLHHSPFTIPLPILPLLRRAKSPPPNRRSPLCYKTLHQLRTFPHRPRRYRKPTSRGHFLSAADTQK